MSRSVIIVTPGPEAWGNFKKMCEAKGFPYHTLKKKKLPMEVKKDDLVFTIYREPLK